MNTPTTPDTPVSGTANPAVQSARAMLKDFQAKFPVFRDCLPLAIGIDKQLLARLPDLDRKTLRMALRFHTHSVRYLKAMGKATVRFDLDGNPADEVTEAHRTHAVDSVRERFKKEADQRKAQREAEETERRKQEKLQQLAVKFGRRNG